MDQWEQFGVREIVRHHQASITEVDPKFVRLFFPREKDALAIANENLWLVFTRRGLTPLKSKQQSLEQLQKRSVRPPTLWGRLSHPRICLP